MPTGPLYMLQVYYRVLGSRSVETLMPLTFLGAFLFAMMGTLDSARGRIMSHAGARFQSPLERRVFNAALRKSAHSPDRDLLHILLHILLHTIYVNPCYYVVIYIAGGRLSDTSSANVL